MIDVAAAARRIEPYVRRTPVLETQWRAQTLILKVESLQLSGSFKARGAFHALLAARERGTLGRGGVVAASGGNHGLAVATAAVALGVPVEIFVPRAVSPVKLAALRATGARVSVVGEFYADALAASAERTDAVALHAYDDPDVVAGQGTLAFELLQQADFDTVLVAVGGGGLLAGTVAALGRAARIVAVEPVLIPTLHAAVAAGEPVDVSVGGVAADALGARRIGAAAMAVADSVQSVLVTEEQIVAARKQLWSSFRIAAEYAGATAFAALHAGVVAVEPGERVAVVVCGGNTDPADL